MAAGALWALLCWSLPQALSAARSRGSFFEDIPFTLPAAGGIPELSILWTSEADQAADFIKEWGKTRQFGLHGIRASLTKGDKTVQRMELLMIAAGARVLIFDLKPTEERKKLPDVLMEFLENQKNTFYGAKIATVAARLAFELDCVIRCVDFHVRAWPKLKHSGGIHSAANIFLGTELQVSPTLVFTGGRRPLGLWQLTAMAEYCHLLWALANYGLKEEGRVEKEWYITMAELYGLGPRRLLLPDAKHNWTEATKEWETLEKQHRSRQQKAKKSISE